MFYLQMWDYRKDKKDEEEKEKVIIRYSETTTKQTNIKRSVFHFFRKDLPLKAWLYRDLPVHNCNF